MSGNSFSTATPITIRSVVSVYEDSVGSFDLDDYWLFTLTNSSLFNLELTGLSSDADVELYDGLRNLIADSDNSGTRNENISLSLNAGNYYIRVYPYSGNTNYRLSISAQPITDNGGNTLSTATPITVGTGVSTYSDSVGAFDPNDYYRFTLSNPANFELTLTGLSSDADVELLNSNGSFLDSSTASGSQDERITTFLGSGTYYIRVYPYSGNTNYNLRVSAQALPTDNAGNTINQARTITLTPNFTSYTDTVGTFDPNDYYRFTLGNPANFELTLTGLSNDADVELLNSNGNRLASSTASGSQNEAITTSLSAGTYYIRVYPYSGDTTYSLNVKANAINSTFPDNAGNTLNEARQITISTTPNTYQDWVGIGDPNDYYRFTLTGTQEININLTELLSDADLELLDSNGRIISSSVRGGRNSETIVRQLNAGTYYIRVYPYEGQTSYNLTVAGQGSSNPPNTPPPNSPFNSTTGYGFANAAIAVAQAINQAPFPDVPPFGGVNDWNINMVNAPEVWARGYTGSGIVVAVLDTGVDRNHPDLSNNIWRNSREIPNNGVDDDGNGYIDDVFGWNFMENKNDTSDVHGHGTHVAGTIAGANNGTGVTGIAYNAKIMPVKVLGDNGSGTYAAIAQGIRYAVDNGAKVINLSLGGPSGNSQLQQAVQYASDRGAILVMAAGNESQPQPGFPARYAIQQGISVGAVSATNNIANFSNRAGSDSRLIHVMNPGVSIYSSLPNNRFESWNGTSMAAPHVAGIVALMLQANPNLTDAQVRTILSSPTPANPASSDFAGASSLRSSVDAKAVRIIETSLLTAPIYRFQNSERPGTYLFVGEEERQNILRNFRGFQEEGLAFKVGVQPGDDLIPLTRFQNSAVPGTYLYAGPQESANIRQNFPNFREEGVAFYVYEGSRNLGVDVYRFQNRSVPGTYIFVGEAERQNILANFPNFVEEGVAFEVGI